MRALAALALITALSGCGLRPLYGGGEKGAVTQALGSVEIGPMAGKAGWLLRQALSERLRPAQGETARYRLAIEIDDQISGFGVRLDDAITRERRTLRARYQLIDNASAQTLLDASAGSDAGIDVVSSEYATVAAENAALERLSQTLADQIVARVALYLQEKPPAATP